MSEKIQPGHGSGGRLMERLIESTIMSRLGKDSIQLDDSAVLTCDTDKIAFTTDTFTITPLVFPGGDIGSLAVNGTVNDLAVMGAEPRFLSCSLILEEGLDFSLLEDVLDSMKREADHAGVSIVTGDTKVVPHGKADKIFINTAGIGLFTGPPQRRDITPGDKIIISGTIGDHGMTIMARRNELSFSSDLKSDCAHLNHLIRSVTEAYPESVSFMRDPTRGGVASVLNEIVRDKTFSSCLTEDVLPVRGEVRGICGILGIDPLYVANEGKVLFIVKGDDAESVLKVIQGDEKGKDACIIGEIDTQFPGRAYMKTGIGGRRILPLLVEEQLPRIC